MSTLMYSASLARVILSEMIGEAGLIGNNSSFHKIAADLSTSRELLLHSRFFLS
jgi:hypothetical protein